jgi:hypothetical protein
MRPSAVPALAYPQSPLDVRHQIPAPRSMQEILADAHGWRLARMGFPEHQ